MNMMAIQAIGTGISAFSAIQEGRAKKDEAAFNRYQYQLDARAKEIEGRQKANQRIREYISATSSNEALFGFMGRDISDRSVRAFLEAQKRVAFEDVSSIKENAQFASSQSRLKGEMERTKGAVAERAGYVGAASSIASGLYRYEQYKTGQD